MRRSQTDASKSPTAAGKQVAWRPPAVVPDSGNARLKVRIGPVPFAGDYYVIGLDDRDYRWAVVGHPSRNYLWILSREPQMSPGRYDKIVAEVQRLGYDPTRIVRTDQSRNLAR